MALSIEVFKKMLHDRIHVRNMNLIIACCGGTGVGKSLSMIALAMQIDPTFSIRERLIFSYLDLISLAEKGLTKRRLPKGSVIIFDETSAEALQARDFMTQKNKNLSALFQTFRNLNYILILVTPNFSFIDAQARKLVNWVILIKNTGLSKETLEEYRLGLFYEIKSNPLDFHFQRRNPYKVPVWFVNKYPKRVRYMFIRKPSLEVEEEYNNKKKRFQRRLYAKLREDYELDEAIKKKKIKYAGEFRNPHF